MKEFFYGNILPSAPFLVSADFVQLKFAVGFRGFAIGEIFENTLMAQLRLADPVPPLPANKASGHSCGNA